MVEFKAIHQILDAPGLRMALLRGVPTPWSEAAKSIFHVKGLACTYAAQGAGDPEHAIQNAFGDSAVPVVLFEHEPPRSGWAEILILAERLTDSMPLIPAGAEARAELFGIAHEICGEMGLGWAYRLHLVAEGAFPEPVVQRLGAKYGLNERHAAAAVRRVTATLRMLSQRLERSEFLVGDQLTAADIYWATFANLLIPLPETDLPAIGFVRDAYTCRDERFLEAISDRLRRHQRLIYDEYLQLPAVL